MNERAYKNERDTNADQHLKTAKGAKYSLSVDAASETVLEVKKKIFATSPSDEVSQQALVYVGEVLKPALKA